MQKNTLSKIILIIVSLLSTILYSQNLQPFAPRYQANVKGDIVMIGNNILNRNSGADVPTVPYNGTAMNHTFSMEYIDIDNDASTFNSSSATLSFSSSSCNKIVYAGLYWSAILQSGSRTDINKVKFQLPTGGYNDIVGQVVYDADATPLGTDSSRPYVCYADVTPLLSGLTNPAGTYTLANVLSSQGLLGTAGLSAGWTLFVVYENQTMLRKAITSFDGFTALVGSTSQNVSMSGLTPIPFGPVRTKFAMAALEGDYSITGDNLRINNTTMSSLQRPVGNFFNSSLTTPTGYFTDRLPNGTNTLGLDVAVFNVNNPANSVMPNNGVNATITLGNTGDHYYYFFNAFATDIVEPNILLTTSVKDNLNNSVEGTNVDLNKEIAYTIGFQNIGNDNATSFTIKSVIPSGVIFNPSDLILPPGTTLTNYNTTTREALFSVSNALVEVGDPAYYIQIKEKAPSTCELISDACSNIIKNQAFATYRGTINTFLHTDEGSFKLLENCIADFSGPSVFTISLNDCNFTKEEIICGNSLELLAATGYDSYVWSGPGTITPVNGTNNQSVTVTEPGIYYVNNATSVSGCTSIVQAFNVIACAPSNIAYVYGNRLYSTITNASTYQWINCNNGNQDMPGENNYYLEPLASGYYALRIVMPDGYQITSDCLSFNALSIDDFNNPEIKLYPNPAQDKFFVSENVSIKKLGIYNLLGQEIMSFEGNSNEYSIGKLQSGTYIIKINTDRGIFNTKIVKE